MQVQDELGRRHFTVILVDMPPTKIVCKCGEVFEGDYCLDDMLEHANKGNREDTPPAPSA